MAYFDLRKLNVAKANVLSVLILIALVTVMTKWH